jgi:hypothetical protein
MLGPPLLSSPLELGYPVLFPVRKRFMMARHKRIKGLYVQDCGTAL